MPIVETCSRGGGNAIRLEVKVHELEKEFGDEIEFRTRLMGAYVPPELLIAIIGTVSSHFIIKLIEKLFEKKEDTEDVRILIIHQDFNMTFNLPLDKGRCVEHFKQLQEKKGEDGYVV
jgi:hypothetical protein